jgi:hypothetical protein
MSSTNKSLIESYAELQKREAAFERKLAIESELRKFVEKGNITLAQKSAFSDIFAAIPDDLERSFLAYDGKGVYEFLWYFLNHLDSPVVTASFAAASKKKNCSKGVSCGNACISGNKICRKPLTPIQKEEVKEVLAVAPVPAKVEPLKTKPELSDAEKEAIATKADAAKTKAENAKKPKVDTRDTHGATLKSKLLDMANGADPDNIKISNEDIEHAKLNFMDSQSNQLVINKTDKMKAEGRNLSDDEALALSTWIGDKYASMNAVLYGGKPAEGVDREAVETTDLLAAKALHKLPPVTKKQLVSETKKFGFSDFNPKDPVGRYMQVENPEEFVKRYQDALAGNGEIRESTLFATSVIPREQFSFCHDKTNLTYEVKPKLDGSGSGRYIDHYKNHAVEGEILYPPQTKFRVAAVIPPKEIELVEARLSPEQQKLDNKITAIKAVKKAAYEFAGYKEKGDIYTAKLKELKEAYTKQTGEKFPSQAGLMALYAEAAPITKEKLRIKEVNEGSRSGKLRNNNWVIQLEEI